MDVINPHRFSAPAVDFDGFGNASRYFDGVSDYIDLGDSDDFSFGDGVTDSPFSVSAWIKMEDATTFRILGKYVNTDEWTFTTDTSDRLTLFLQSSNGAYISRRYSDSTTFNTYVGQWIHVVSTYDGSKNASGIKLYINGSRVDDIDVNSGSYGGMSNTTYPCEIGSITAGGSRQYAKGHIADCRLYNSELSSTDIAALYGGENITTNLVGHWLKDTPSLLDHSGTNDGTNKGSAFAYDNPSPAVEFGKASRYFDGVNDSVNLGDADDFSFDNVVNDSPFSISLWFKSNLSIGNIQTLVAKATSSSAVEYLVNLDVNGKITLTLHQNSSGFASYIVTGSTSTYTKDKWHHAVVTYDGSLLATGIKVYVDGVDDTGTTTSGGTYSGQTNTTAVLLIGNRNTSSGQEMSGNIADVRIYDTDLSSTDIAALYGGENITTNLVGHWLTNTDDVKDYAGVNDGTNNGSTYSFDNPLGNGGQYGSASREFNGSNSAIQISQSAFPTGNFSISCWVKPHTSASYMDIVTMWTGASTDRSWALMTTNGARFILYYIGVDTTAYNTGPSIPTTFTANNWYHVGVTYENGVAVKLYQDGVQIAINTSAPTLQSTVADLFIGNRDDTTSYDFDGNITDVRIYDTALTGTDMYDLSRGYDFRTNLVGQWLTNKDDVDDYAGTNHGTNNGSTYSQDAPL